MPKLQEQFSGRTPWIAKVILRASAYLTKCRRQLIQNHSRPAYRWLLLRGIQVISRTNRLHIMTSSETMHIRLIWCRMLNPVNDNGSDRPFTRFKL